jgi:hypothetical protein
MTSRLEEDKNVRGKMAAAKEKKRPVLPRHGPFCLGGRFYLPYLGGGGPLIDWLHHKSVILKKNEYNIRERLKILASGCLPKGRGGIILRLFQLRDELA